MAVYREENYKKTPLFVHKEEVEWSPVGWILSVFDEINAESKSTPRAKSVGIVIANLKNIYITSQFYDQRTTWLCE